MIKYLTVTNYVGDTITFDLRNPEESGFLISNITGITPVNADINVTEVTTTDGGIYNSARIDSRNIIITAIYLPGPTIEDARHIMYKYFPIKKKVELIIETDTRKLRTEGYVESNNVKVFTKQEYSQISILCPDPYFYSVEDGGFDNIEFSGIEANFEFPFYSDENVDPEELIEFSTIEVANDKVLHYTGDIEIGAKIVIRAYNNLQDIVITNETNNQVMTISSSRVADITGEAFRGGDILTINTNKGKKSIILERASRKYNILNALNRNSKWITISRGDNVFLVTAGRWDDPSLYSTDLTVSISASVAYEGV